MDMLAITDLMLGIGYKGEELFKSRLVVNQRKIELLKKYKTIIFDYEYFQKLNIYDTDSFPHPRHWKSVIVVSKEKINISNKKSDFTKYMSLDEFSSLVVQNDESVESDSIIYASGMLSKFAFYCETIYTITFECTEKYVDDRFANDVFSYITSNYYSIRKLAGAAGHPLTSLYFDCPVSWHMLKIKRAQDVNYSEEEDEDETVGQSEAVSSRNKTC